MDNWTRPNAKVAASTAAGGIAVIVVIGLEYLAGGGIPGPVAATLVAAVTSVAGYLMPDVPPWKRNDGDV